MGKYERIKEKLEILSMLMKLNQLPFSLMYIDCLYCTCGISRRITISQHTSEAAHQDCAGGYFASLRARPPRASFCEPRKITPKKSKNGHNALKWYLLHAGSTIRGKFGWNRANDDWSDLWPVFIRPFPNSLHKRGEVRQWCTSLSKWNSQQMLVDRNNWTTSRGDPEYWHSGIHPLSSCVDAL